MTSLTPWLRTLPDLKIPAHFSAISLGPSTRPRRTPLFSAYRRWCWVAISRRRFLGIVIVRRVGATGASRWPLQGKCSTVGHGMSVGNRSLDKRGSAAYPIEHSVGSLSKYRCENWRGWLVHILQQGELVRCCFRFYMSFKAWQC